MVVEPLEKSGRVMDRPRDEGTVGSEAAVGDEEVQVRMPVGARAVRLQTGDDADGADTNNKHAAALGW